MKVRKSSCGRFTVVAALLSVAASICAAQNESGLRPINKEAFSEMGGWPNDSNIVFQVRYPIIRSLPPINSGMPYEVLQSYLYLDSIARFDRNQTVRNSIRGSNAMTDILKSVAKHLYRISDYDPMAFSQYMTEGTFKIGSRYVTSIDQIRDHATRAIYNAVPAGNERAAISSLMLADYILRVKVLRIDSAVSKKSSDPSDPYLYRVMAEVVDTLKGRMFLSCMEDSKIEDSKAEKNSDRSMLSGSTPCLSFLYVRRNYFDPRSQGSTWTYGTRDSAFLTPEGGFRMQPGQEAIVFLSHYPSLYDSAADYFDIRLEPAASFNALPIIDGQVRDINRVWSDNLHISYDSWKQRLFVLRDKILAATY